MECFSKSGARITERVKKFCNETDDVKTRTIISDVILERVRRNQPSLLLNRYKKIFMIR